jgi:hypothetical protein
MDTSDDVDVRAVDALVAARELRLSVQAAQHARDALPREQGSDRVALLEAIAAG